MEAQGSFVTVHLHVCSTSWRGSKAHEFPSGCLHVAGNDILGLLVLGIDFWIQLCLVSHRGQQGHLVHLSHLRKASGSLKMPLTTHNMASLKHKERHTLVCQVCRYDSPELNLAPKAVPNQVEGWPNPRHSQKGRLAPLWSEGQVWVTCPLLNQLPTRGKWCYWDKPGLTI